MHKKSILAISIVLVVGLAGYYLTKSNNISQKIVLRPHTENLAMVEPNIPADLSDKAKSGKVAFDLKCASCHGENAAGQQGVAPPLIHKIYEPSHHADESFQRAVKLGVRSHHWSFGDMAPIQGLTRGDVATIVAYIRELQRANGIE